MASLLTIPHVLVKSSMMRSAGYSERYHGILEIQFTSGKVHRYSAVPAKVFQDLINAPSPGQYFNAYIKGKYFSKLVAVRPKAVPKTKK